VYEADIPVGLVRKANLEGFQWNEFASGEIATPASPIAPDLASGVISKKGAAVFIVFIRFPSLCVVCATSRAGNPRINANKELKNKRFLIINVKNQANLKFLCPKYKQ
jgi:hypothetical protein